MLRDAIPDLQHEPSPLHAALLDLPWSDVFTTNYDTLLERARRSVISQRYDLVLKPDDLGHSNRPRIVKLHGSLPSERPFIITDEDYRRYPNLSGAFVNAVRQALLENTLCLVGFSGDDPNFLHWIGWLHDNLGHLNSSKTYLVGLLHLSPAQKTLLERRNIIPVDMSLCPDVRGDHYQALQHFLSYLKLRRARDSQLAWPARGNHDPQPPATTDDPRTLVAMWKAQRLRYPGWVVLPEDLRLSLWHTTRRCLEEVPTTPAPFSAGLDLEFAFELTWRSAKCLCPIFDNHAAFLDATIDRHWQATASNASRHALPPGLTLEDVRHKCHYLLLAMMRYYREEGLSAKWGDACARIQAVLPTVTPELKAQFYYERALFALFALDLQQLTNSLADWPRNNALPFWEAKKAGLFAEIGHLNDARHILRQSLDTIREKLNLTPPRMDYTLLSQESFVMYLLHAVSQPWFLHDSDQLATHTQRREFQERWHVLQQYKCDPWHATETFAHQLQRPHAPTSDVTERPAFDIGLSIQTHSPKRGDRDAMAAYNFLRFSEDAGIPFRVPGCALTAKSATGILTRIADYSSYWALATLVRIGDDKAVEEIFDRPSLARMSTSAVDSLIERYLQALRGATADVIAGDRLRAPTFGTLLAGVLPEILSRLCCKSSLEARTRLLEWLLEIYRSEHRSHYRGIRRLVRRLLKSSAGSDGVSRIPQLLEFPMRTDGNALEQREYPNPFDFLDLSKAWEMDGAAVHDMPLASFFNGAASDSPAVRKWAVSTLGCLHEAGLLSGADARRFGAVLWSRVDDDGLPAGTNYNYRIAFMSLPHPGGVEPAESFIRYVRAARFPKQESKTRTTIQFGGDDDVAICYDIREAREVHWSRDDVYSIVHRLVEWWDVDKAHWRRAPAKELVPSIRQGLERRLAELVRTLAAIVMRCRESFDDEDTRESVKRVAEECRAYGVPALRLEVACAYAFGVARGSILQSVEDAMASSCRRCVIDALEAMDIVSQQAVSESTKGDLMRLLGAAGGMIRWRPDTALEATLKAVGDVVKKHPETFAAGVERDVLTGLGYLVTETAVGATSGRDSDGSGRQDVSRRLIVRRAAAGLARRLYEHYGRGGRAIPDIIGAWEKVCRSDSEFVEIKTEWLAPRKRNT